MGIQLRYKPYSYTDDDYLGCPKCGDIYLHQGEVILYERVSGEDSDGRKISITQNGSIIKTDIIASEKMPGRRQSLHIKFECENGHKLTMSISQNKGNTHIEWI